MTVSVFADILGVNPETVRRWIRTGRLKLNNINPNAVKPVYVIDDSDALDFLKTYKHGKFVETFAECRSISTPNTEDTQAKINALLDRIVELEKQNEMLKAIIHVLTKPE